ncbi:tetratricopeptide repeat protein [bacterium]|nr:tetratricopeptide repeat protein [bacterium]
MLSYITEAKKEAKEAKHTAEEMLIKITEVYDKAKISEQKSEFFNLLSKSDSLISEEKFDEASDYLKKAEELIDDLFKDVKELSDADKFFFSRYYTNWGKLYSGKKDYKEAFTNYAKAVDINPTNDYAYFSWGLALSDASLHEEAEIKYRKVIEINPSLIEAHVNLGNSFYDRDEPNYDEAIIHYQRALEIDPDNLVALSNLGSANLRKEDPDYDKAITLFSKAIKLNPNFEKALLSLAIALGTKTPKEYEESIVYFKRVLSINPTNASAYYGLACCYCQLFSEDTSKIENKQLCLFNLRKAIKLDSNYVEKSKTDEDLDFLRDDTEFIEIVEG